MSHLVLRPPVLCHSPALPLLTSLELASPERWHGRLLWKGSHMHHCKSFSLIKYASIVSHTCEATLTWAKVTMTDAIFNLLFWTGNSVPGYNVFYILYKYNDDERDEWELTTINYNSMPLSLGFLVPVSLPDSPLFAYSVCTKPMCLSVRHTHTHTHTHTYIHRIKRLWCKASLDIVW